MTRRVTAIFALCLCCTIIQAKQKGPSLINYGAKTGFSSAIYEVRDLVIAGVPIKEYMAKSEISSFYTAFTRLNIKRHYIQTEASYNITNYSIDFNAIEWNPSAQPHEKSAISTKIIGIEVPLYYGYHIVKEGPYGMSFFIGPKAKFTLTDYSMHNSENIPYTYISESINSLNFSLMTGFGVNISRVFFDFAFEYGLHNISKGFTTIDFEDNMSTQDMVFNRRKNVLSFSIGFMF
ncbi:MAG: PorT family protein [Bacteroidaceae bacterium]|nr:PorT family protein [Bacteroidaceae bacterium]